MSQALAPLAEDGIDHRQIGSSGQTGRRSARPWSPPLTQAGP